MVQTGAIAFLLVTGFHATAFLHEPSISPDVPVSVCISTSLDPKSYRANPGMASKSEDFLTQIEGDFSQNFKDYIIIAFKKTRRQYSVSSAFLFKPYSATAERTIGIPVNCGIDGVRINIVTHYIALEKSWLINIDIQSRRHKRHFSLTGHDQRGDCRAMCRSDPFGGMSKAVEQHSSAFLQFIMGGQ